MTLLTYDDLNNADVTIIGKLARDKKHHTDTGKSFRASMLLVAVNLKLQPRQFSDKALTDLWARNPKLKSAIKHAAGFTEVKPPAAKSGAKKGAAACCEKWLPADASSAEVVVRSAAQMDTYTGQQQGCDICNGQGHNRTTCPKRKRASGSGAK